MKHITLAVSTGVLMAALQLVAHADTPPELKPPITEPKPPVIQETVIVEQVQRGAPTWKEKLKVWRHNTAVAIKHLDIRKAQNWNDNVDFLKLKTKQAGPYLSTVAAGTGILFNINNMRIRR